MSDERVIEPYKCSCGENILIDFGARKTLRDEIAIAALAYAMPTEYRAGEDTGAAIARRSYEIADAMLRAREAK